MRGQKVTGDPGIQGRQCRSSGICGVSTCFCYFAFSLILHYMESLLWFCLLPIPVCEDLGFQKHKGFFLYRTFSQESGYLFCSLGAFVRLTIPKSPPCQNLYVAFKMSLHTINHAVLWGRARSLQCIVYPLAQTTSYTRSSKPRAAPTHWRYYR